MVLTYSFSACFRGQKAGDILRLQVHRDVHSDKPQRGRAARRHPHANPAEAAWPGALAKSDAQTLVAEKVPGRANHRQPQGEGAAGQGVVSRQQIQKLREPARPLTRRSRNARASKDFIWACFYLFYAFCGPMISHFPREEALMNDIVCVYCQTQLPFMRCSYCCPPFLYFCPLEVSIGVVFWTHKNKWWLSSRKWLRETSSVLFGAKALSE